MPDDTLNPMANDAGWPHMDVRAVEREAAKDAEIERLRGENERLRGHIYASNRPQPEEVERMRAALQKIIDDAESDDGATAWDGADIAQAALAK